MLRLSTSLRQEIDRVSEAGPARESVGDVETDEKAGGNHLPFMRIEDEDYSDKSDETAGPAEFARNMQMKGRRVM